MADNAPVSCITALDSYLATKGVVRVRLDVRRRRCHSWRVQIWWLSSPEPGPEEDLDEVNVGGEVVLDKVVVQQHADLRQQMQLEVELAKGKPGESVTCEDDLLPVVEVGGEDVEVLLDGEDAPRDYVGLDNVQVQVSS